MGEEGENTEEKLRDTDPICFHDTMFLIIDIIDNYFRKLEKSCEDQGWSSNFS